MSKKNFFISLIMLLVITTMLSSCFLWHDKNRADRGRRFPHDDQKGQKKQTR